MNPVLADPGSSFKGAFLYYMHDVGAMTRDRIAWAHTENMLTDNPDLAWKVMAYTAKHQDRLKEASGASRAGRKAESPVMSYSLSWHPEQNPDKDHMLDMALKSIKALGMSEHECLIVAHRDRPHKHVHVILNRIHPITGIMDVGSYSKRKLSDFALEYARKHGLNYCPQREENARKREEGKQTQYRDNRIQEAWSCSDDGKSLISALKASGLILAQGNKRLVVVDSNGKAINPVRHIEGIRAKDFRLKLIGVDLDAIPSVEEAVVVHRREKVQVFKDKEPEPEASAEKPKKQTERTQCKNSKALTELRKTYRIDEDYAEIRELSKKVKKAQWWKKVFGLTRRDRKRLKDRIDSYREKREVFRKERDALIQVKREPTPQKDHSIVKDRNSDLKRNFEAGKRPHDKQRQYMGKEERLKYLKQIRSRQLDRGIERDI